MLRKVVDNVGYAGLVSLFVALFYYSVFKQWDWRLQIAVYGGAGLILAQHLPGGDSKCELVANLTGGTSDSDANGVFHDACPGSNQGWEATPRGRRF